jgi:uncharacterized membrane-anchored protein|tara:strand:+ start:172 stop:561 length:390 start_codon:yes stop_codon:yes gene_type:complete
MAKHRRISDNPKPRITEKEEKTELVEEKTSSTKTPNDIKSIVLSGSKYLYIIVAAALLSGIFTPLTIDAEWNTVISGMLSVFLGLGGGIVIFLGIKNQKFTTIMICGGLGMMIVSLILIYEIAERSLFG